MNINRILKDKYTTWQQLEQKIESLPTAYEIGEVFEEFAWLFFKIQSTYYQVKDVWRVKEIPAKILSLLQIERSDAGVDGLIQHVDGTFTGYQVKFRSGRQKPSYSELTKFWQEARHCDFHLTFANCNNLTELSDKNIKHLQILSLTLDELERSFFDELNLLANAIKPKPEKFLPAEYQNKMILDVVGGFNQSDRGKLIAACGTGKTLTALWISEEMKSKRILFIAPSIALIKQTLKAWSEQSKSSFQYVCICSDSSVADDADDMGDLETSDLGIPVTTDASVIAHKLKEFNNGVSVVFTTYQSLGALRSAVEATSYEFDLAFFDEAHRTAGTNDADNFSLALFNENIPIKKRLFMTATERLIRPKILKKAAQFNRVIFSMDDPKVYGDVFHRFNFGEAIAQKVISDYRVIIAGVRNSEVYELIKGNKLLVDMDINSEEWRGSASNLFKQVLLLKVMDKYPVKKTITFHNSIKLAKDFIYGPQNNGDSLTKTLRILKPAVNTNNYYLGHVNGGINAAKRHEILMEFKDSEIGVVSNSRCLTEGVDVPIIDSIYFVDPRNSLIDIVQACGRALRKPRNGDPKLAYFIIPILIPDGDSKEALNEIDYDMIHMLIQSLRDQDNRLEQWVENLNLSLGPGVGFKPPRSGTGSGGQIECFLPTEFDLGKFEETLYVRIAEVNKNPETTHYVANKNIGSRKSGTGRVFRTIGDYNWSAYDTSLVKPSIAKFNKPTSEVKKSLILKINHNAASHGIKLGTLEAAGKDAFILTDIGKLLKEEPLLFKDVFKEQILKYYENNDSTVFFPYREILKLLCEFKSMTYFEFCFAVYGESEIGADFHTNMSARFKFVRNSYANVDLASEKNKTKILKDLNAELGTVFTEKDVWTTSTTVSNQWGYWRNHLSLFCPIIEIQAECRALNISEESIPKLEELLKQTHYVEEIADLESLSKMYKAKQFAIEILNPKY